MEPGIQDVGVVVDDEDSPLDDNGQPLASAMFPTAPHAAPDTISLKDFHIDRLLGRGDVGRVFLVRSVVDQTPYAMKVLNKAEMVRRNKVQRIISERNILASSAHPFIITLHGAFQDQDNLYMLMDFCSGGELFHALHRQPGRRLPESDARFYAAEVLSALEYLHTLGVIYRDLKPENILLDEAGHIRLSDFDLSKAMEDREVHMVEMPDDASIFSFRRGLGKNKPKAIVDTRFELQTNSFVGTEEYLAPEVIRGPCHTQAVDFWSFGILIFEMVYGVTPFYSSTRRGTFSRIVHGALKFPDAPKVSSDFKNLIKRLLHPDPAKRLGAKYGAAEIKDHPWFDSIDFRFIYGQSAPLKPLDAKSRLGQVASSLASKGVPSAEKAAALAHGMADLTVSELSTNFPREELLIDGADDAIFIRKIISHSAGGSAAGSEPALSLDVSVVVPPPTVPSAPAAARRNSDASESSDARPFSDFDFSHPARSPHCRYLRQPEAPPQPSVPHSVSAIHLGEPMSAPFSDLFPPSQ
jgi:serine/threonine protein kinase